MITGAVYDAAKIPTSAADPPSSYTSQTSETQVRPSPNSETVWPVHRAANRRFRRSFA